MIPFLRSVAVGMNTDILNRLIEFESYSSPPQVGVLGEGITSVFSYHLGVPRVESWLPATEVHRIQSAIEDLPPYLFHSIDGLKYIFQGFYRGGDGYKKGVLVAGYIGCRVGVVALPYWEMYVEPWLHLPNLLLNRPNAKITEEVLAYWSVVAEYEVSLASLERAIRRVILSRDWNDDVWIDAQLLLSDAPL